MRSIVKAHARSTSVMPRTLSEHPVFFCHSGLAGIFLDFRFRGNDNRVVLLISSLVKYDVFS